MKQVFSRFVPACIFITPTLPRCDPKDDETSERLGNQNISWRFAISMEVRSLALFRSVYHYDANDNGASACCLSLSSSMAHLHTEHEEMDPAPLIPLLSWLDLSWSHVYPQLYLSEKPSSRLVESNVCLFVIFLSSADGHAHTLFMYIC